MELGKFCLSLTVKDIAISKDFYETMGFEQVSGCGSVQDKWLIMQNGDTMIGLFQDMFDKNIMTFNPTDVRGFQAHLQQAGISLDKTASGDSGPAHIMFRDPDGNLIMLEQY